MNDNKNVTGNLNIISEYKFVLFPRNWIDFLSGITRAWIKALQYIDNGKADYRNQQFLYLRVRPNTTEELD